MVSLSRHLSSSGSGAVFFDQSHNMDDEEYLQPVLVSQELIDFEHLTTVPIVSISLLFGIAIEITGILFISLWPEENDKCDGYFILLYLHCAYWLLLGITDVWLREKHDTSRICGYLDFYQSTAMHVRAPLLVSSLCNTLFLFLSVFLHHTHKSDYESYCKASEWLTPLNYIALLTTMELTIIIPFQINYIKRVIKFNKTKPPPDVTREEWITSFTQDSFTGEVGYRQSHLGELLSKQADLIRYLRDHNVQLSHKMMLLASQRRNMQS